MGKSTEHDEDHGLHDGDEETVVTEPEAGGDEAGDPETDACLVVLYGQHIGRRYFLKPRQVIGRSENADIQVDQDSVSRRHAVLAIDDRKRVVLQDMDSTNGTFVNDRNVDQVVLRDGDLLRVGQTVFKYLAGGNVETKYHEEIYRLTTIDGLTQVYNKRFFLETLERERNRARRYGRGMSLVLLDIDHFKSINDRFGHLAGDYVLREIAALITHNLRSDDIFARYGGEEFALILPEIDAASAVQVCEKIRRLVESHSFTHGDDTIQVTISLGVYALSQEPAQASMDLDGLIGEADARLYRAKESGRNRVCV